MLTRQVNVLPLSYIPSCGNFYRKWNILLEKAIIWLRQWFISLILLYNHQWSFLICPGHHLWTGFITYFKALGVEPRKNFLHSFCSYFLSTSSMPGFCLFSPVREGTGQKHYLAFKSMVEKWGLILSILGSHWRTMGV